jgi:hypothetical protein
MGGWFERHARELEAESRRRNGGAETTNLEK